MNNLNFSSFRPRKKQGGAVLAVGLVFLVLLTLLGVTAMQVTGMEERMAGNLRDRNLAFQAAEFALREGEESVRNQDNWIDDGACRPFCGLEDAGPDLNSYAWDGTSDFAVADPIHGVAQQPRYFIEYLGLRKCTEKYRCDDGGPKEVFRITVRATGRNPNTVVLMQTTYQP